MSKLLNIGFKNHIPTDVILAVVCPDTAPIKRKIEEAKANDRIVDVTFGRRTRTVIITKSNHVILSAIQTDTIAKRFNDNSLNGEEE